MQKSCCKCIKCSCQSCPENVFNKTTSPKDASKKLSKDKCDCADHEHKHAKYCPCAK